MAALLETSELTKRFVRKPDLAARIAGRLTGQARTETVHAVEGVSLAVAHGEVLGSRSSSSARVF